MDYPAWQQVIREAKAISDAEIAEADRIEAEKLQASKLESGKQLVKVLEIFGINADINLDKAIVGDFTFSLQGAGLVGEYPNCRFNLQFSRNTNWTGDSDDYPYGELWGSINCFFPLNTNDNLVKIRAQLCAELDRIEERFQQQHETWLKKQSAKITEPRVKHIVDTPMTRFMAALRETISEQIKNEIGELIDLPY